MRRNVYINVQVIINSLLLLMLFSCTFCAASDSHNKKSVVDVDLLPSECSEYDLVSGNLRTASTIYMDTGEDYPWYQDAVCAGKLISRNQHGSQSSKF